jgi:hypothetical protein
MGCAASEAALFWRKFGAYFIAVRGYVDLVAPAL